MLKKLRQKYVWEEYIKFLNKFITKIELVNIIKLAREASSTMTYSYPHTLLIDYLIFWTRPNQRAYIIRLYKQLNLAMVNKDNSKFTNLFIPRPTIRAILKRNEFMFLPFRAFGHPVLNFNKYLKEYILLRQLKDDITDYKDDLKQGKVTYATFNGVSQTQKTIQGLYKNVRSLEIPLFYEKLFKFYIAV